MRLALFTPWWIAMLLLAFPIPMAGQSINPATRPQVAPMTAQEKKNLDFVMKWWREVLYAGHLELAPKYQAENYIQHNPNANTGRAGFVEFFGKLGRTPMNPIPAAMPADQMPVVSGAKGDYVWLVFEHADKDPRNPASTYHYNSFDVLRIENGHVQEHWDSAHKMPGTGVVKTGVSPRPPMQWNTGRLSREEEKTLAMATEELKDMLQYGHLELADKTMDPGYIQHNPNVPQGRDGFEEFMRRVPGRTPRDIKPEWVNAPVLTLINGPYSFMMWERTARDPDDPNREYTWNHFDVVRTENNLIKEHWDEARINPPAAAGAR
ncbi:MAG TPA: nuclear transport factor 2 family protein [Vicinamibacterales bacterium]|jgi:predicted SnoaL-like aldol condensation-catalyzing enzyme|nr:nuclear transport factor 2 family protein [Vicinamibacterales bacterium]